GVTRLGAALTLGSFALLGLVEALPFEAQLGLIVVAAIGFDFAIQATLVAHQTIVYGIDPPARSRLNAVLFTGVFVGMASGAGLGSMALAQWGWSGVVALAIVASCGALLVRLLPASRP
ncbi:MFS transporter, partial [Pseudomonas sp. GD04158]|nr:MFS transporter [Pseudomonas sp. GD04158]